ncbi:CIC11C00000004962 [Sungouiella intermedia]|uniref:Phosphatidylinositol 4-kinase n=1 Tax=Sungouiella intermedia TaxID=45354 RepID=A0A1L0DK41_9ASCO|nr:CIC11C00000004962 [[Candida] intermedia]
MHPIRSISSGDDSDEPHHLYGEYHSQRHPDTEIENQEYRIDLPSRSASQPSYNLLASLPRLTVETSSGKLRDELLKRRNSENTAAYFSKFSNDYILSPKNWFKPSKKKKKRIVPSDSLVYQIEYSVFHPIRNLHHINDQLDIQTHLLEILKAEGYSLDDGSQPENYIAEEDFRILVATITHDVEFDSDLKPQRISQGSSGSYFILGKHHQDENNSYSQQIFKRGIFKPKDEEPYGPLSPKWTKWIHRTFFPCFFGRSCLTPNQGYISEAAACVLDRQLLSYIVPYTDVIYLKSNLFYYSVWERTTSKIRRHKIGSFQMFLNGYMEAHSFFKMYPVPQNIDRLPETREYFLEEDESVEDAKLKFKWSQDVLLQFQEQLEKLVILDYIMRNTDRGADNWMIKIVWKERSFDSGPRQVYPYLKVGAIDSGLAFPWKHPDEWRSFPFGWLFLPYLIIGQPFSRKTRQHYLPLLTLKYWWEQTITKLKEVFSQDQDFKEKQWTRQVAVLKGQAFNVVEILKLHYAGPLELTRRENLLIWDDEMNVPILVNNNNITNAMESSIYDLEPPSKRVSIGETPFATQNTETTPLLKSRDDLRRQSSSGSLKSGNSFCDPLQMSGFEYNLNIEDSERQLFEGDEETSTKKVIIERLEKVDARLPFFTWC